MSHEAIAGGLCYFGADANEAFAQLNVCPFKPFNFSGAKSCKSSNGEVGPGFIGKSIQKLGCLFNRQDLYFLVSEFNPFNGAHGVRCKVASLHGVVE